MDEFSFIEQQIDLLSDEGAELISIYGLFWEKTAFLTPAERIHLLDKLAVYNHTHPLAKAWNVFTEGECFVFSAEYLKAIDKANEAYELFNQLNERGGIMAAGLMLSMSYRSIGKLDKAQDYSRITIDIAPTLEPGTIYDYLRSVSYYQASELQILLKKYSAAIDYLSEGIKIAKHNPELEGRMYTGMGNAYMYTPEWKESKDYFLKALTVISGTKNFVLASKIYADLGNYYFKKGDLEKALTNQEKSLEIRLENNLLNPAIANYIQLAELYDRQGDSEKAIRYAELAIAQAEKTKVVIRLYEAHQVLSKIYDRIGEIKKAYHHFKKYHEYREYVFDQEVIAKIEQVSTQHRVEIMAQEKEIFRLRSVELKQVLDELKESVTYAKRIQKAILPPENFFKKYFPESFIFYQPKDIVSGDFYWMDVINDIPFLATCDCTGHGVPGAMVSVVCHNALNRSVREFKQTNPSSILDKTRELVIEQFQKSEEDVKDGMDCVFCMIDIPKMQLSYAAANNNFYIIREGELIEQRADKMPVGKFIETLNPFTQSTIALQKGDTIYTFTDGYADQFGGPKGKKFGYKQFEKLLISIATLPMLDQKEILEKTIEEWKLKEEQIDDILIIGIKI